eukprot:1156669-Pelagomonas_calceolata.AAC.1
MNYWRDQLVAFSSLLVFTKLAFTSAIILLSFLLMDLSSFSACRTSLSLNFVVGWPYGLCTKALLSMTAPLLKERKGLLALPAYMGS